jgi:hypothetical protein
VQRDGFKGTFAHQQSAQHTVACFDGRAADPHIVLATVVAAAKRMGLIGRRLDENQNPAVRLLGG